MKRATTPEWTTQIADGKLAERLIVSDAYIMQEKVDGQRLAVRIDEDGIRGYNKRGEQVQLHPWLYEEMAMLPEYPWGFDGEYGVGGYHIFDLVDAPRGSLLDKTLDERIQLLGVMIDTWGIIDKIFVVRTWSTPKEKLGGLIQLSISGAEGAVFKPRAASAGFSGQVYKYKFRNTVDAVVISNHDTKASINVGVYKDNVLTSIGNCSLLGRTQVDPGSVVEISYRVIGAGGHMVEPVFSRVRTDKPAYSCVWDQLEEGKHLQDRALLDDQVRKVSAALGMDAAELQTLTESI